MKISPVTEERPRSPHEASPEPEGRARPGVARAAPDLTHIFQAILDGIPAPIFFKDERGVYVGCNRAFAEYLGREREEIVGKTVFDVAPRDLAVTYDAADRALLASRTTQVYESAVRYADGSLRDVVFHKGVFLGEDGRVGGQVGTILDITARKRAERALRESEERHRAVVSALDEGIILKDRAGRTLAANAAAARLLGLTDAALAAHVGASAPATLRDALGERLGDARFPLAVTFATGEPCANVIAELERPDRSRVWLSMNSHGLFVVNDPLPYAVVLSLSDVTERKVAEDRLAHQAFFDALTGLPNRLLFERRLAAALASATEASCVAVLFVDLDRFKAVNDALGHEAGDALLRQVAARLGECVRAGDTVARMGGDEFTILLHEVGRDGASERVAQRVLAACRAPFVLGDSEIYIGASVGVSLWPIHGGDADLLLRGADRAMFRAKAGGKDGYRVYSPDMDSAATEALSLEAELHRAIERDELRLHYQPKFETSVGRLVGFEALVRWQHPTRGLIPPGAFIPAAEKSSLIVRLGAWVLVRACEQAAAWRSAGLDSPPIAVNVSARQFDDGAFLGEIGDVLAAVGLPPELLEIELTEGVIMRNVVDSAQQLARLRALGVRVAIDDFGTGYSSLSYLQRLPIDLLKIDRSFVNDMDAAVSTLPLVQAIIALAHSLGMPVIAEGVETQAQLEALQRLGCDQIQGYLLGRPVPPEEAAARWLVGRVEGGIG